MAANIENYSGTYSFVENTRNAISWHRLGKQFDRELTSIEAITECRADFTVNKKPILFINSFIEEAIKNGEDIPAEMLKDLIIKNRFATVRDDKEVALGIVSDGYGIVQNRDAFGFIDQLVGGDLLKTGQKPVIECAGLLGDGNQIFITAKFPEVIKMDPAGKDICNMYVVFTSTHDGTGAIKCMVTPIRVCCNNTLNLALRNNTGKMSLRHSRNVLNRMDLTNVENAKIAYATLNLYNEYKAFFESAITELSAKRLNDKQIDKVLAKTFLNQDQLEAYNEAQSFDIDEISTVTKHKIETAKDTLSTGVGQELSEAGTGLWLVNGLTTLYQNTLKAKDDESFFKSVNEGNVYNKIQTAYKSILAA